MKKKHLLLLLSGLVATMVVNSCKKDNQNGIQTLFTGGSWQLASVMVFNFIGNSQTSVDTLNTNCGSTQLFTFNSNGTCTYQNFDCLTQPTATGPWLLSTNQLYLQSSMVCKDTTTAGSSMPFSNAQIQTLGNYSLVLLTGDIQPNYSLTKPRRQVQYGFVRRYVTQ